MKLLKLKSQQAFSEVFAKGAKRVHTCFVLYRLDVAGADSVHIGVIASKKQFKRAVDRNFAKRRLRALARDYCLQSGLASGVHIIMVARSRILHADFHSLQRDLKKQ